MRLLLLRGKGKEKVPEELNCEKFGANCDSLDNQRELFVCGQRQHGPFGYLFEGRANRYANDSHVLVTTIFWEFPCPSVMVLIYVSCLNFMAHS